MNKICSEGPQKLRQAEMINKYFLFGLKITHYTVYMHGRIPFKMYESIEPYYFPETYREFSGCQVTSMYLVELSVSTATLLQSNADRTA